MCVQTDEIPAAGGSGVQQQRKDGAHVGIQGNTVDGDPGGRRNRPGRHHPASPAALALADGLAPAQLMAIAQVAHLVADMPGREVDDDLVQIQAEEREADLAARRGDNEALICCLLLIAALAVHAAAQLDAVPDGADR